ncbi:MAG: YigZ family protein [Candidatus Bipolaricaulota bacterium]
MNQREFRTFAEQSRSSLTRKGSRFIGVGACCETKEELDNRRGELADEFPKASHVASASVIAESGRPVERYDNDGEPSGTAGEPMLEVLKGEGLMNTAVFAVRYFGGTELGTGGLVRAYSDTARAVISSGKVIKRQKREKYLASFPYSFTGKVAEALAEFDRVKVLERNYGEEPELTISVPVNDKDSLLGRLRELTSGSVEFARKSLTNEEE